MTVAESVPDTVQRVHDAALIIYCRDPTILL
jgi:hypothetical protein